MMLPEALALLPPEAWTEDHLETLVRDVLEPINARRRAAGRRSLSARKRTKLLFELQVTLARAVQAYQDEATRHGGALPTHSDIKHQRSALASIATVDRVARAIAALPFDVQDRLARLTYDELGGADPKRSIPADPTHLSLKSETVPVQAVRLGALARAARRLLADVPRRPRGAARPQGAARRALLHTLIRELLTLFARFTDTRPTRVISPGGPTAGRLTGRLERFVRVLVPAVLHDPDTGLDHQIRAAIKEMSGAKSPKSS